MKLSDLIFPLNETPLPPDWEKEKFSPKTSFRAMIAYAKERAKQVGRGSSRVAFEIPYQGRKTVLKVALNRKGIAQNQEEARLLDDGYLEKIGITIPLIDFDQENGDRISWIHTEFAEKITQKQLEQFFGHDLNDIAKYLDNQSGVRRRWGPAPKLPQEVYENEYFQMLQDLTVNYTIPADDLTRKANWGLYQGEPVIIDLGYTTTTMVLY